MCVPTVTSVYAWPSFVLFTGSAISCGLAWKGAVIFRCVKAARLVVVNRGSGGELVVLCVSHSSPQLNSPPPFCRDSLTV